MTYRFFAGLVLCFLVGLNLCVDASELQDSIDKILSESNLAKVSTIGIKIVDQDTKKVLYKKNSHKLLQPASTLKIATSALVLSELGKDYKLTTALYKKDNKLYLKLSGNPLFTKKDLAQLFKDIDMKQFETIVIDNTLIDRQYIGVGWMWDNFASKEVPRYSIFNIDGNLATLEIIPNKATSKVQIISDYPQDIVNYTYPSSKKTSLKIEHKPWLKQNAVYVSGSVKNDITAYVPVRCPRDYFLSRLNRIIPEFKGQIQYGDIPRGAKIVSKHEEPLMDVLNDLNKNSNNMSAETMFKIAAAEHFHRQGTTQDAIKLFEEFYGSPNADIVDASGLSHNNLLTIDFLSDVLVKYSDNANFRSTLAVPGQEGTLKKRLEGLKIQGKTGTLSGVSGICGYLKSKSGKNYIFSILIQNFKGRARKAKLLENKIIEQLNWF